MLRLLLFILFNLISCVVISLINDTSISFVCLLLYVMVIGVWLSEILEKPNDVERKIIKWFDKKID